MAITITEAAAALAIRAGVKDSEGTIVVDPTVAEVVAVLFPAAAAMVVDYAPNAPDAVHNASLVRVLGFLYDSDPSDNAAARPLDSSGAAPMLSQWRAHRAAALNAPTNGPTPTPTPTPTPGGNVPTLPAQGHFILTSDNGELQWVAFPAP